MTVYSERTNLILGCSGLQIKRPATLRLGVGGQQAGVSRNL